jgi:hypothetical protein
MLQVQIQQLNTKVVTLQLQKRKLEKKLLRQKWCSFILMFVVFLGIILTLSRQQNYNLGKAVINSGICVEHSDGFACETHNTFIEK